MRLEQIHQKKSCYRSEFSILHTIAPWKEKNDTYLSLSESLLNHLQYLRTVRCDGFGGSVPLELF